MYIIYTFVSICIENKDGITLFYWFYLFEVLLAKRIENKSDSLHFFFIIQWVVLDNITSKIL